MNGEWHKKDEELTSVDLVNMNDGDVNRRGNGAESEVQTNDAGWKGCG